MDINQIISGIAYFERLFRASGLWQNNENVILRRRLRINCPITNRRFQDVNAVRQFCLPFLVAVRNALLVRPWDILNRENSEDLIRRFTALVELSWVGSIDYSSENFTIDENWLRGHQIIEALQQRNNNNVVSSDLNAPIVQEYRAGGISQTISATETPALLSRYTDWQLSVLTGVYEGVFNFNIISNQAQNDFTSVNQQGLQNTTFSELLRRLTVVSQALRTLNSSTRTPPNSPNSEQKVPSDFSSSDDEKNDSGWNQVSNGPLVDELSIWDGLSSIIEEKETYEEEKNSEPSTTEPLIFSRPPLTFNDDILTFTSAIPPGTTENICSGGSKRCGSKR